MNSKTKCAAAQFQRDLVQTFTFSTIIYYFKVLQPTHKSKTLLASDAAHTHSMHYTHQLHDSSSDGAVQRSAELPEWAVNA